MGFETMSWGQAVSYVQAVGGVTLFVILSIPVGSFFAIRRGRRNRPGGKLFFARGVFWGWFALLGLAFIYFLTGAWYGENGPPPQVAAVHVTVELAVTVLVAGAIHYGLYVTTNAISAE
jgi:hypothetical protein